MAISTECGNCGRVVHLKDEFAGRRFKCKSCDAVVRVPVRKSRKKRVVEEEDEFESALNAAAMDDGIDEFSDSADLPPRVGRRSSSQAKSKQRTRKKKSRKKRSLGRGFLGPAKILLGVSAGIGGLLLLVWAALAAYHKATDVTWQEFSTADDRIRVSMPGKPLATQKSVNGIPRYSFHVTNNNFRCGIEYSNKSAASQGNGILESELNRLRRGAMGADPRSTILPDRIIELEGLPGRELVVESTEVHLTTRIYLAEGLFVIANFMCDNGVDRPEKKKFFDSLQISGVTPDQSTEENASE